MAKLRVYTKKIIENYRILQAFCACRGLSHVLVSKLVYSKPEHLSYLMGSSGLRRIADTNAKNLLRAKAELGLDIELLRLRRSDLALIEQGIDTVHCTDPSIARDLALAAARYRMSFGRKLGVMITLEYGDFREGVPVDQAAAVIREFGRYGDLEIQGVAVNIGCLRGLLPSRHLIQSLARDIDRIESECGHRLERCSVGGTLFYDWLYSDPIPKRINEFRCGEAVYLGIATSLGTPLRDFFQSTFEIGMEIIEIWSKELPDMRSSTPKVLDLGLNAFGVVHTEPFSGKRRRAVLEGGENVAPMTALQSKLPGCTLVAATHDHTVVDVQDCPIELKTGMELTFYPGYDAVFHAVATADVEFINE